MKEQRKGTQHLAGLFPPQQRAMSRVVSINQLVDIVEAIAKVKLKRNYQLDAPKGVRGRSSDNTLIKERLGWAPSIRLNDGMAKTYTWIKEQMESGQSKDSVVNRY